MSHDEKDCVNCADTSGERTGDALSPTEREVLERAAKRPDGNVCPTNGLHGGAQPAVLTRLRKRGYIPSDGSPEFTAAGRAARVQEPDEDPRVVGYAEQRTSDALHCPKGHAGAVRLFDQIEHDIKDALRCPSCDASYANVRGRWFLMPVAPSEEPRTETARPTTTSTGEIDPRDPYWHGRPLWVIYGPKCHPTFICAKLRAYNEKHALQPLGTAGPNVCIWGYSVYKRVPGFRTMGTGIEGLDAPHFFADQDEALGYLKKLTTPLGDAGRIG
jgi:hypothetical protein